MGSNIEKYAALSKRYVENQIDLQDYYTEFRDMFDKDALNLSEVELALIDKIAADIYVTTDDVELIKEMGGYISEKELREILSERFGLR